MAALKAPYLVECCETQSFSMSMGGFCRFMVRRQARFPASLLKSWDILYRSTSLKPEVYLLFVQIRASELDVVMNENLDESSTEGDVAVDAPIKGKSDCFFEKVMGYLVIWLLAFSRSFNSKSYKKKSWSVCY